MTTKIEPQEISSETGFRVQGLVQGVGFRTLEISTYIQTHRHVRKTPTDTEKRDLQTLTKETYGNKYLYRRIDTSERLTTPCVCTTPPLIYVFFVYRRIDTSERLTIQRFHQGFRVQGLRLRVQGRGFRVQGLGFRVQGLGLFSLGGSQMPTLRMGSERAARESYVWVMSVSTVVQGLGFRVQGLVMFGS